MSETQVKTIRCPALSLRGPLRPYEYPQETKEERESAYENFCRKQQLTLEVSWADLTVLDLSLWDQPGGKAKLANTLNQAIQEIGFFYITNTGLSQDQIDHVFAVAREIFDLPRDEKMKFKANIEKAGYPGFKPPGGREIAPGIFDNTELYSFAKFIPGYLRRQPAVVEEHHSERTFEEIFDHGSSRRGVKEVKCPEEDWQRDWPGIYHRGYENAENELLHILVGDDPQPHVAAPWQFKTLDRPKAVVVDLLMDVYFARAHWFMLLFHAPTAKEKMRHLWQKATWQRTDAGDVLVVLAIVALGGICVLHDSTWHGHKILDHYDIDLSTFSRALMSEVKDHLLEVMGDCSLATVQLCLLFCRYCTYTGNSGMGRSLTGMAARNAYAAGLHIAPTDDGDSVQNEVRRRVWLTAKTTDTFSAFYHGRPPSLDSSFRYRKEPHHMDDMELPPELRNHPLLNRYGAEVNLHTFHRLKYEIYDIMSHVLSAFRRIREEAIFADNYLMLVKTIHDTHAALDEWRTMMPSFFDHMTWETND